MAVPMLLAFLLQSLLSLKSVCPHPVNSDCSSDAVSLLPCLPLLQMQIKETPDDCCVHLQNSLSQSLPCLCDLIHSASQYSINETLALELPLFCNVHNFDASEQCGGSTGSISTGYAPPLLPSTVAHHGPPPPFFQPFGSFPNFSTSSKFIPVSLWLSVALLGLLFEA